MTSLFPSLLIILVAGQMDLTIFKFLVKTESKVCLWSSVFSANGFFFFFVFADMSAVKRCSALDLMSINTADVLGGGGGLAVVLSSSCRKVTADVEPRCSAPGTCRGSAPYSRTLEQTTRGRSATLLPRGRVYDHRLKLTPAQCEVVCFINTTCMRLHSPLRLSNRIHLNFAEKFLFHLPPKTCRKGSWTMTGRFQLTQAASVQL